MEIKYRDAVYVLTAQSGLEGDDCPGEVVLGVFPSAESAAGHFNEMFGVYKQADYVHFDEQDGLFTAEEPFPGVFIATIQRVQFSVIDPFFALGVLRNSLRSIRAKQEKISQAKK